MFSGEKEFTDDAEDTFINVGMPVNNKEKIFGLSTDESTYAAHTHCPYRKTSQKFTENGFQLSRCSQKKTHHQSCNPLSVNLTKWSNALKKFVDNSNNRRII